jgi:hypothetical protein
VARDVARGYFTRHDARADYGVALTSADPPAVDLPETERLRRAGPNAAVSLSPIA